MLCVMSCVMLHVKVCDGVSGDVVSDVVHYGMSGVNFMTEKLLKKVS